jgi:hypothetical protein
MVGFFSVPFWWYQEVNFRTTARRIFTATFEGTQIFLSLSGLQIISFGQRAAAFWDWRAFRRLQKELANDLDLRSATINE